MMIPRYHFKLDQEAVWFVLVAGGTVILQALATLDVDKITDWRVWLVGLLAATIRAGAGAALSLLNTPHSPAPADPLTDADIGRLAIAVLDEQRRRSQAPTPPRQPDSRLSNPMAGSG